MNTTSDWNFPEPRAGLAGKWDRFVGPGASTTEQVLPVAAALIAATFVVSNAAFKEIDWTPLQFALAALLAFDLFGGPATLATSSAKRWYHRSNASRSGHLQFVSSHILQIGLVAFLFRSNDWLWLITISLAVFSASSVVLSVPLHLQRAVAYIFACAGAALGVSVFSPTPGMEWFVPVLFIKLVIAHSTVEEPYVDQEEPTS